MIPLWRLVQRLAVLLLLTVPLVSHVGCSGNSQGTEGGEYSEQEDPSLDPAADSTMIEEGEDPTADPTAIP